MNMPAENIVVIYHAHCPDGFGAAYAAWKTLGSSAWYIPLPNCALPPDLDPATRIYILVLSFSRDRMLQLHQRHGVDNVMVLDHHVSAQRSIGDLPNCYFDMARSGAVITWEHFHPNQPRRRSALRPGLRPVALGAGPEPSRIRIPRFSGVRLRPVGPNCSRNGGRPGCHFPG